MPNETNKVDVKLKLEEQNRNQLTFGAGVSEFEGFFGQLSFQTANFLGRGESLTLSLSAGSRAQNYSLAFSEPFLFDRNITGGANMFKADVRYIGQFTQKSSGAVLTMGFPISGFSRMFVNYSYERVRVTEIADVYQSPDVLARNPFLRDSLLLGVGGERIISKVVPSYVYNTVDQPIFPTNGKRFTTSIDLAGLGGNTNFYKPMVEGVWFIKQATRLTLGMRAQAEYIHAFTGIEGAADLREAVPRRRVQRPRLRHPDDRPAGSGHRPRARRQQEPAVQRRRADHDCRAGAADCLLRRRPGAGGAGAAGTAGLRARRRVARDRWWCPGRTSTWQDFKTSTGLEVRFFMPVLNVPFRLIFAYNPQRTGVLDNTLQPQKAFQFRFAVGSTF